MQKLNLNKETKQNFIDSRNNYLMALAINETNLKIDRESKQETLNENKFYKNNTNLRKREEYGQLITNHNQDYNMTETDFKKYSIIADKKRKNKGLKLPYNKYEWAINENWNLSADCESRPLLRLAEKVFIKSSLNILPKELKEKFKDIGKMQNYTQCKKFIEINLKLNVGEEPKTVKQLLNEVIK